MGRPQRRARREIRVVSTLEIAPQAVPSAWPDGSPRLYLAVLATLLIPAAATLWTIDLPRSAVDVAADPTPFGYAVSQSIFLAPIAVLWGWYRRATPHWHARRAFWLSLGCLAPMGCLLDVLLASTLFEFRNEGAVIGLNIPVVGGSVPVEEFVFYIAGFVAILLAYIWFDRELIPRSRGPRPQIVDRPLVQWRPGVMFGVVALYTAAVVFSMTTYAGSGVRFPTYLTYLLLVPGIPTILLLPATAPVINWRALTVTTLVLVLVSLFWEATLGVPYGWWNYRPEHMVGIHLRGFADLPIEEPIVWIMAGITTVVFYEAVRLRLARGGALRTVLFAGRP